MIYQMIAPKTKRRYNLTYVATKKGFRINGNKHTIIIYFDEITKLINCSQTLDLIQNHNFKVVENNQLKLNLYD